jgi:hypothetical protein
LRDLSAGRFEDARALIDERCEIARVLLLAGRSPEADVLWRRLRDAEPDGVWTLNAGGLASGEVGRDEQAVEWLAAGLRVAIGREDPEHVVDQMCGARRVSLRRLGVTSTSLNGTSRRSARGPPRASTSGYRSS